MVNLTDEEIQKLKDAVAADATPSENNSPAGYNSPIPDEKQNAWTFLKKVMEIPNTMRVGNLSAEEVGIPPLSLRTLKECELISSDIIGNFFYAEYFRNKAEILSGSSLSKDAKLISLSSLQRREIADTTKPKAVNSGWFGSRKEPNTQND
jgi:hypothetical protein